MALQQILVDSSFLYALLDKGNTTHQLALETIKMTPAQYLIPDVVLTEAAFLFNRSGGVPAVIRFADALIASQLRFEPVLMSDLKRIREIMADYRDAKLDFVDCCIMTLSERMNITKICTLDRRDFSIFRPKHCGHLEIIP